MLVIFFVANFCHLVKTFKKNKSLSQIPCFLRLKNKMNKNILPMISTIFYNMKGCLRFFTFIFFILSNLAKYAYG